MKVREKGRNSERDGMRREQGMCVASLLCVFIRQLVDSTFHSINSTCYSTRSCVAQRLSSPRVVDHMAVVLYRSSNSSNSPVQCSSCVYSVVSITHM